MNKGEFKVGDIYIVKFHPTVGNEIGKYRPAVVISNVSQMMDDMLVMISPITSFFRKKKSKFELSLPIDGSLLKQSTLLLWYIKTFSKTRFVAKIGSLNEKQIQQMRKILLKLY